MKKGKKGKPGTSPPWGRWEVLLEEGGGSPYKVKRIIVFPGNRLSYQRHFKREERWTVVEGRAVVTLEGKEMVLEPGQSIEIPCRAAHRVANRGRSNVVFIEIQRGSYLGEDDIVRLDDDFGRVGGSENFKKRS